MCPRHMLPSVLRLEATFLEHIATFNTCMIQQRSCWVPVDAETEDVEELVKSVSIWKMS